MAPFRGKGLDGGAGGACPWRQRPGWPVADKRRIEEHRPPVSVARKGGGATSHVSPPSSQQGEGAMTDTIERTETHRLIASNKVEGTAVYNLEIGRAHV